jgi:uncharacterized CHY-type Zn-finger protein
VTDDPTGGERDTTSPTDRVGASDSDAHGIVGRSIGDHLVSGVDVDASSRCAHYGTDRDVVAIRFACCDRFYPCHACHDAVVDHDAEQWPRDRFDEPAVLCGGCANALAIEAYLGADDECPTCGHAFNPGCAAHADRYFEVREGAVADDERDGNRRGGSDGRGPKRS